MYHNEMGTGCMNYSFHPWKYHQVTCRADLGLLWAFRTPNSETRWERKVASGLPILILYLQRTPHFRISLNWDTSIIVLELWGFFFPSITSSLAATSSSAGYPELAGGWRPPSLLITHGTHCLHSPVPPPSWPIAQWSQEVVFILFGCYVHQSSFHGF